MLSLAIDNPIIKNFFYQECNQDTEKFLDKIGYLIEINQLKDKLDTAFIELDSVNSKKLKSIPMNEVLDNLDD